MVSKIFPFPVSIFAFVAKEQMETHIDGLGECGLVVELYKTIKWSSNGTDLLRKIQIIVKAHIIYKAFTFIRHAILKMAFNISNDPHRWPNSAIGTYTYLWRHSNLSACYKKNTSIAKMDTVVNSFWRGDYPPLSFALNLSLNTIQHSLHAVK